MVRNLILFPASAAGSPAGDELSIHGNIDNFAAVGTMGAFKAAGTVAGLTYGKSPEVSFLTAFFYVPSG